MALWLMENDFKPIPGYDFQFRTRPMPAMGFDGIVYCKVLEIVPFKKLSYSWKGGPEAGQITLDSVVVWTLQAKENGTELSLVHNGFTEAAGVHMYAAMQDGWLKNMHKILAQINTMKDGTPNT